MRIATWNINGIRSRVETAVEWLRRAEPDVVCFQEIKCVDEAFPREPFESLGYNVATHGQKGFNGVAILSRSPLADVTPRLPGGDGDDHARFIEAVISVKGGAVRVVSLYLPNGNPIGTEKFAYKLAWMERLIAYGRERLALEEPLILAGDFNVIPQDEDCNDPAMWSRDALIQPETRAAFRRLENLGYTDALRAVDDAPGVYTFWDYQAGAWQKNWGVRIDHLLLSPQAADRLTGVTVEKHVRAWEKPSDHVPVVGHFAFEAL